MSTGVWVGIWVLLVIAALAAFALIALHLFRRLRVTLQQAQGLLELLSEFSEAMDAAQYETPRFSPDLLADLEQKDQWRRQRRVNRVRRKQRKNSRRERTLARWRNVPTEAIWR